MVKSKSIRKNITKKLKTSKSSRSKKPTKLLFRGRKNRLIVFVLLFAAVGSYIVFRTLAATNVVSYQGQLSSSTPSQSYTVSVSSGTLIASHSSKDKYMRVAVLNSTGNVIAEKTGSKASVSATVSPGTYTVRVDYTTTIKGVKKYTVSISYPTDDPPPPPTVDITPPQVLISAPTADVVSGTVTITAISSDDVAVSKVDLSVDGQVLASDSLSPYSTSWNTTTVTDGSHTIQANSYDTSGNMSTASRPITVTNATSPPPPPPSSYPAALWHANADVDTSADSSTETNFWKKEVTSSIWSRLRIVNDPLGLYGKVYYANITAADIAAGNKRAEWRGAYNGSGGTASNQIKFAESPNLPQNLWMGWRSIFGPDLALNNNENDGNFMQLKGDSSCGGPAVGITVRYSRLSLRTIDGAYLAWNGPLMTELMNNQWHSFVLHVNFAKDSAGYLELWMDGQRQTMANGQTTISLPTVCPNDSHVFPKFGTYGMDVGKGVGPEHWVESPRIGTSYESVVPR